MLTIFLKDILTSVLDTGSGTGSPSPRTSSWCGISLMRSYVGSSDPRSEKNNKRLVFRLKYFETFNVNRDYSQTNEHK